MNNIKNKSQNSSNHTPKVSNEISKKIEERNFFFNENEMIYGKEKTTLLYQDISEVIFNNRFMHFIKSKAGHFSFCSIKLEGIPAKEKKILISFLNKKSQMGKLFPIRFLSNKI